MVINFLLPYPSFAPSGGYRVVYEYSGRLAARGHSVNLVHPCFISGDKLKPHQKLKIAAGYLYKKNFNPGVGWMRVDKRVAARYVRTLSENNVPDADFTVAAGYQTADYMDALGPKKGAKIYLVMDFDPWLADLKTLSETWKKPVFKIAISGWLLKKITDAGGGDATAIPPGVATDVFRVINPPERRDGTTIAFMYHRAPYKDIDTALKAIDACKNKLPRLKAVCYGPDASRKNRKIPQWIERRGTVDDEALARLYNECAVFVSSSAAEGFAYPPAEAMASGCAVAATDSGGINDYAKHGVNCLLSAPGDYAALAGNIAALANDDALRVRIAAAGTRDIRNFNWDRSVTAFEAALKNRGMS